jgi:hypothetical protein
MPRKIEKLPITWQLVRGIAHWNHIGSWTSPIIGWFGDGFYSHCDVLTPGGFLRGARSDVIRSIPAGVEDRPHFYETWARCTRFTINVTMDQYDRFWAYSDDQLHKPYDSHGLIETFVLGRQWRDDDAWWCSEMQAMNGEVADLWEIPQETLAVTPGDFVFLLAGAGAQREEIPV